MTHFLDTLKLLFVVVACYEHCCHIIATAHHCCFIVADVHTLRKLFQQFFCVYFSHSQLPTALTALVQRFCVRFLCYNNTTIVCDRTLKGAKILQRLKCAIIECFFYTFFFIYATISSFSALSLLSAITKALRMSNCRVARHLKIAQIFNTGLSAAPSAVSSPVLTAPAQPPQSTSVSIQPACHTALQHACTTLVHIYMMCVCQHVHCPK